MCIRDRSETINFFDQGNYTATIESAQNYLEISTTATVPANYLIGHSYFNLKEYANAASYFQKVMDEGERAGQFYIEAQWYWVLTQVAMEEELDSFQHVLTDLIEANYSKAIILNSQLNSFWRH